MKKIFFILSILFLVIFCLVFFYSGNLPVSSNKNTQVFIVSDNEKLTSIAKRLADEKLIKNQYIFLFNLYKSGNKSKIQSGKFRLSSNLSTIEIINKLITGGSSDYWLKIIEGQRVEEITPRYSRDLEGYIFPDSYLIPDYYTPPDILKVIQENFTKKINEAKKEATNKMSEKDIVILASLLEREARLIKSKQMIAGIILNRYEIGMALQLDATVQYAKDTLKKPDKYWQHIEVIDLKINSLYNTYKNPGFPPGPICNPGYNSLFAAYHPIESDYLYYITGNDGNMYYAKTLSEHNSNIAKYLK